MPNLSLSCSAVSISTLWSMHQADRAGAKLSLASLGVQSLAVRAEIKLSRPAKAGAEVRMVGAVGDGYFGRFLFETLGTSGVDSTRVACLSNAASGMSVAISATDRDYGAVIVSGANLLVDPAVLAEPSLRRGARALILQNEMPEAFNLTAAQAAKAMGARVCLNAAPYRPLSGQLAALVDLLVVNAIEAEEKNGAAVTGLDSAATAAVALSKRFPSVVVTAGRDGVTATRRGGEPIELEALPVRLVSTHGAGDTFVGVLVTALARGGPFSECLNLANVAAAAHVSTKYADPPDRSRRLDL